MSYTKGTSKITTKGLVYHIDIPNPLCYHIDKCYSMANKSVGTIHNNIEHSTEGKGSLDFNGTNHYIDVSEDLEFTTEQSIDVWIKPKGTGHNYQRIIDKSNGNNALNGYSLIYHPVLNMVYYVVNNDASKDMIGYRLPSTDTWINIIVTKSNTEYNLYINSVLSQQNTGNVNFSSENPSMRIGAYTKSQERNFNGKINNIKIYNRALTPKEVSLNYTALRGRFIN